MTDTRQNYPAGTQGLNQWIFELSLLSDADRAIAVMHSLQAQQARNRDAEDEINQAWLKATEMRRNRPPVQPTLDVDSLFQGKGGGVYVLKVRGDSMIGDSLCDGDYVVIERREDAKPGEQVVVLLDSGEAMLRKYHTKSDDQNIVVLKAANPQYPDREVHKSRCRIQGVVIGVLRSYSQ